MIDCWILDAGLVVMECWNDGVLEYWNNARLKRISLWLRMLE
jgi:hypothetical protein